MKHYLLMAAESIGFGILSVSLVNSSLPELGVIGGAAIRLVIGYASASSYNLLVVLPLHQPRTAAYLASAAIRRSSGAFSARPNFMFNF